MSKSVRAGLPGMFHSVTHVDVCIRFHLERTPEEQQRKQQQEESGVKGQQQQQRHADGGREGDPAAEAAGLRFVGDPLPAHKVILSLGSTYLKAKLQSECWQGGAAGTGQAAGTGTTGARVSGECEGADGSGGVDSVATAIAALPVVLVPMENEVEVSFAREALKYIYTGSLSADLGFEALLRVRQQACYLGIEHCPQACDREMVALLQRQQQQQQGVEGASTSTGGGTVPAQPRVLQAYACRALFPEPGTSPDAASFDAVRSALAKQLVSHFGDAVAALTRPDLYRQLLQLPAVAVRELLAADDLGTDSEDSVFLLLACWLDANKGEEGEDQSEAEGVSAATRAELCGLVRLHRLSRMFLHHVLPVYEPFDISRAELGFLLRYAGAREPDKDKLLACNHQRQGSPWYCSPARRQVVPEKGHTVEWSISREDLEEGLRRMAEGKKGRCLVLASFGASAASALGDGRCWVLSRGLQWTAAILLNPESMAPTGAQGSAAAGILFLCYTPQLLGNVFGVVYDPWLPWGMQLTVHRSGDWGRREGFSEVICMRDMSPLEPGWARWWPSALKLGAGVTSSGSGGDGDGGGGKGRDAQVEAQVAAQLARWSEWMHEGKVTGRITFMK